ncbi:MAG TPA: hypothetical protein VIE43_02210 [Thermoanaerobaculia bacterium]|nr:hypothetical protein [Thermoanaerobaculia bacterium]
MVNDGYSWVRRNEDCLRERFLKQPNDPTLVVHIAEDTPLLVRLAKKSAKTAREQRADILKLRERLGLIADETGYKKLEILSSWTSRERAPPLRERGSTQDRQRGEDLPARETPLPTRYRAPEIYPCRKTDCGSMRAAFLAGR